MCGHVSVTVYSTYSKLPFRGTCMHVHTVYRVYIQNLYVLCIGLVV